MCKAFRRQCIESKAKTMKSVNKQASCRIALSGGRKWWLSAKIDDYKKGIKWVTYAATILIEMSNAQCTPTNDNIKLKPNDMCQSHSQNIIQCQNIQLFLFKIKEPATSKLDYKSP